MARRVFFSFHYEDIFAVNVVRMSNVVKTQYEPRSRAFFDKSLWEESKKKGDPALRKMIDDGLDGSSVTCVLIGQQTWARPWVRYELLKSFERGNGIFGVHIHDVAVQQESNTLRGLLNPQPFGGCVQELTALSLLHFPQRQRGANPLDYVGFWPEQTASGFLLQIPTRQAVPCQLINGKWERDDRVTPFPMNDAGYRLNRYTTGQKFSSLFPVYDWNASDGYKNFNQWAERAAQHASWL